MPAVNFDIKYLAMVRDARDGTNQVVYGSQLPDWRNQTLTPNLDTICLMPFLKTKDVGLVVLEIPSADRTLGEMYGLYHYSDRRAGLRLHPSLLRAS
jgi:hypothetical protein